MKQKIQQLLIKYTNEDKYADENFVKTVLDILMCEYGDNDIRGFVFVSEEINALSDFEKLKIKINLDFIKSNLLDRYCYDDKKTNLYMVNIYVILVLMHEFNHFRQRNTIKYIIDSNDFLDKLFIKSFVFLCSNNLEMINKCNNTNYTSLSEVADIYEIYHDCFVVERLAQIESYRTIIDVISPISKLIGKAYYWFLNSYYSYKVSEYYYLEDGVVAPIDLLLANMCLVDSLNSSDIEQESISVEDEEFCDDLISSYGINERISYGLPITEKEYFDTIDFMNLMYTLGGNKGVFYQKEKIKIRKKDINE